MLEFPFLLDILLPEGQADLFINLHMSSLHVTFFDFLRVVDIPRMSFFLLVTAVPLKIYLNKMNYQLILFFFSWCFFFPHQPNNIFMNESNYPSLFYALWDFLLQSLFPKWTCTISVSLLIYINTDPKPRELLTGIKSKHRHLYHWWKAE